MKKEEFEAMAEKAPREQKLEVLARFGPLQEWVKEAKEEELVQILYGFHLLIGAEF